MNILYPKFHLSIYSRVSNLLTIGYHALKRAGWVWGREWIYCKQGNKSTGKVEGNLK